MDIRIAGTVNDSIVDGPGIRFSVFSQGCRHSCKGCQNPQAQSFDGGQLTTVDALMGQIERNPLLRGVTFTGGDPFDQPKPFVELAERCRAKGLDVWAYSGYTYEQILAGDCGPDGVELLRACDVLVDGPFVEELKSMGLRFRGSSNQRIIDVQASMSAQEAIPLDM